MLKHSPSYASCCPSAMHARRKVNRLKRRRKRHMLTRSDKGMSHNIYKRNGLGLVDEAELDTEAVLREAIPTPTPITA